jgi:hypothetical protein
MLVAEMKAFEQTLGVQATGNFLRYSDRDTPVYRCYFTGTLELPDSYRALHLTGGTADGCSIDTDKYDVFFYPAEVVASGSSPVTPALAAAPLERMLVVVPHEDFHGQADARGSPPDVAEAAATLVGFLTASEFAKEKYGTASRTFERLNGEAALFSQKAALVNLYFDEVAALYSSLHAGGISREQALLQKRALFADLRRECDAIRPEPVSFNRCPAILNNAGLAFDRTYTRHYPAMFELYQSLGADTKATIERLRRLLAA